MRRSPLAAGAIAAALAAERGLATAHLDLTLGRDQAITLINGPIGAGVLERSEAGLNRQLVALATGRQAEIARLLEALQSRAVSDASKSTLARALDAAMAGQALSALRLQPLTELPALPAPAQEALAAVPAELEATAGTIETAIGALPPGLREFVPQIVQRALQAVQALIPALAPPSTETPAAPETPATPELGFTFPFAAGSFPLPVDPRNFFNLAPDLAAPCNLSGFLPSFLPFNPFAFLPDLPGLPGLVKSCEPAQG